MSKVYLIEKQTGCYDTYQCNTIRAFLKEEDAQQALKEHNADRVHRFKEFKKWRDLFNEWDKLNPKPPYNTAEYYRRNELRSELYKANPRPDFDEDEEFSLSEFPLE